MCGQDGPERKPTVEKSLAVAKGIRPRTKRKDSSRCLARPAHQRSITNSLSVCFFSWPSGRLLGIVPSRGRPQENDRNSGCQATSEKREIDRFPTGSARAVAPKTILYKKIQVRCVAFPDDHLCSVISERDRGF